MSEIGVNIRRKMLQKNEMRQFSVQKQLDNSGLSILNPEANDKNGIFISNIMDDSKQISQNIECSFNHIDLSNENPRGQDMTSPNFQVSKSQQSNKVQTNKSPTKDLLISFNDVKHDVLLDPTHYIRRQDFQRRSLLAQIKNPVTGTLNVEEQIDSAISKSSIGDKVQNKKNSGFNLSFFKKTNIVKKFITNMLQLSKLHVFKHLTLYQFSMIGDYSSSYEYYQQKDMIVSQGSKFCLIWESINTIIWIMVIFYIPYRVNFVTRTDFGTPHTYEGDQGYFEKFIIAQIFLETLIKLNEAIFVRGRIITDRHFILSQYIKEEAKYDVFILLCFILSYTTTLFYLQYALELRIFRVIQTYKGLYQKLDQEAKHNIIKKISMLVLIILTFINLQGSIFVLLGIELHDDPITFNKSQNENIQRYVAGLYWSTITMTTIGYGDIIPKTTIGRIYVSIVSLISCGIFGYSINQIGEILADIQEKSDNFNTQMQRLNKLMMSRNLSKEIMYSVLKYFEYLHEEEEDCDEMDALNLIDTLPPLMREKIMYEMNHKLFYEQKAFSLNFSRTFLDKLSVKVKSMKLGPETDLFKQDDLDNRLYFVWKGSLSLYFEQNLLQKDFAVAKKGDMIGDIEFFSQSSRGFGAKSLTVVKILYIDFDDFYNTLKLFDKDFEMYNLMKDRLRLEGNLKFLNKKCQSCSSFNHLFINCISIQYDPKTSRVIQELNRNQPQERSPKHLRSKKKSYNALLGFYQIGMELQDFMMENGLNKESYLSNDNSIYHGQTMPVLNENLDKESSQQQEGQVVSQSIIRDTRMNSSIEQQNTITNSSVVQARQIKSFSKIEIPKKINALLDQTTIYQEENYRQREISRYSEQQGQQMLTNKDQNNSNNQVSFSDDQKRKISDTITNSKQTERQYTKDSCYKSFVTYKNEMFPDAQEENLIKQGKNKLKHIPTFNLINQDEPNLDAQNALMMFGFDRMKSYTIYFPHNNVDKVLVNFSQKQYKDNKKNKKKKKKLDFPVAPFVLSKFKRESSLAHKF